MMRVFSQAVAVFAFLVLAAGLVGPASAQSREEVRFSPGNDNAAVEGTITGDEYKDYVLGARAGQTMSVSLITEGSAYFNILPPGSDGVAIYNGSIDGENASVALPSDGDYTIRVYLMGNARDSNQTVPFMVSMTIM
ncbi:hypothetical protein [Microbaculum marinisediminis]|uniref:DNA breaking-rejoining protein n=1 Tax=Microbaculum marinisediminis TaxID=2931392 RepID=A0AAW5QWU6_9HYPH|nr:hypothetical protein [Microbaculum sp. A6E488]MCT8972531.1 hypothetical protein [Microbaculum sp. A6E488]